MKYISILISLLFFSLFSQTGTKFTSLESAAISLTKDKVTYDPSYFVIKYPMGDVPANKGVCTDVIIRAYRKIGKDLQQLVHEDMAKNFSKYPKKWGLKKTDKNIDHRRVYNLMVFFERFGTTKTKSLDAKDYVPGDIVCWLLGGKLSHIGIVSNIKSTDGLRYQIVHNVGSGQVLEDCLFSYTIIGHYKY
jgi:uncharacterized protein